MSQRPSAAPLRALSRFFAHTFTRRRWRTALAASGAMLLGASTLLFARGDINGALSWLRGSALPPADTVVVFGPRVFTTPSGSAQNFVETFNATIDQTREYSVRLVNGDSTNGTLKATAGYVRLNGVDIISNAELAAGQTLVKSVILFPNNTLQTNISGPTNARVTVTVRGISDPMFPVLTERMFERSNGKPKPDTVMFTLPASAGTPFTLFIRNGEYDGTRRNSSSEAWVNGVQVLQSNDLNQNVQWLKRTVSLSATPPNRLIVEMAGTPGSRLYFRIVATDITPPVITINEPIQNQLTRDATVQVSGNVRDETALNITVNGAQATVSAGAPGTVNFSATAALPNEGNNPVLVRATNAAGLTTDSTRTVIKDTQAPTVTVTAPVDNLITNADSVTVTGSVSDQTTTTANLNGIPLTLGTGGSFSKRVALAEGRNFLTVTATDTLGNSASDVRVVIADRTAPTLTVIEPTDSTVTNAATVTVRGTVFDSTAVTVTVNGTNVPVAQNGSFTHDVTLVDGLNTVSVVARDAATNQTAAARRVYRDVTPPVLTLTAPANGLITNADSVDVSGVATDAFGVAVTVNGVFVTIAPNGGFGTRVGLLPGANLITVVATDGATNSTSATRTVTQDKLAPTITITAPANGTTTNQTSIGVTGTIVDSSAVTATINGQPLTLGSGGSFSATVNLVEGLNTITISATDAATNNSTASRTVTRNTIEPGVPPDPSTVAPALDRTIATNPATAAQFLYSGATPIQIGVQANAIDVSRQAVIRGRVLNAALQPLQGVTIAVRGAPQLGSTKSRVDGWYDLALNGGGVVTLDYAKTAYLPAQRQANAPWQDFVIMEDVILLQPDAATTTVAFGSGTTTTQVVRGNTTTDADGPRQATLLVEPGTQATVRLADGTTQPATSLTLRVTEFTVGNNGAQAMPAMLPPTSNYTYAAQVTADGTPAGSTVEFSTPVPFYVENFLEFPVGLTVPVGAFDPSRSSWVPEPDGRIIKILSLSGGVAQIDANGDATADSDAALAALGIDTAERQQLATTYQPGAELWRTAVRRTWTYDLNYGARILGVDPTAEVNGGCTTRRSDLIGCEVQVTRQDAPVQGAPFSLAYTSNRAPGAATSRQLEITLTGATISPDLRGVELDVQVGGRTFKQSFAPAANLTHSFLWDGKDAYGRTMQGSQPTTVIVKHKYPIVFRVPVALAQSFGLPCDGTSAWPGTANCLIPTSVSATPRALGDRQQVLRTSLGGFDPLVQGIGGLTPSIHHVYDPVGRVLYKGDGTRRSASVMPPIAKVAAGNGGSPGNGGDGTPATTAQLGIPWGVTVGADGSLYVLTAFSSPGALRRVRPDGIIERVAGSDAVPPNCALFFGNPGCGDDGPAVNAGLNPTFNQVALDPSGNIYIVDLGTKRVRRVAADGIIRNFAGAPGNNFGDVHAADPLGDGGPATQAGFVQPIGIAVAPDGAVYISDTRRRVRRVGTDGIITTFAGTGVAGYSGDGGPARLAQMEEVKHIALGPDGSLYIVESNRIRRVTPDGIMSSVVGGTGSFTAQGVAAITTRIFQSRAIAVSPDGTIYFTDHTILRRIGTDGIVTTVAGRSVFNSPAALDVALGQMESVAVGPDGAVYVGVSSPARVYRITPAQSGFSLGELAIADDQDDVIHIFHSSGRHLRTIDATTRVTLFSFTYDAQNRLTGIVDQFNQTTQIVRDANGIPLRLVASTGQTVNIALDANGYMASLTGPDGRPVQFLFTSSGLLTRIVNENGKATNYGYDAQGRLTSSTDANNALQTTIATGSLASRTVTFQSTGERSTLQSIQTPLGGTQLTERDALNRAATATENPDGSVSATHADGTTISSAQRPHPLHENQSPLTDVTIKTPAGLTLNQRSGAAVVKDAADNIVSETDSSFTNGRLTLTTFDYGTRVGTRMSAAGRRRVALVNAAGLVQRDSVAGILGTGYTYDVAGRLTSRTQGNRTWGLTYDAGGRLTTITNAKGESRRIGYDASDRPTSFVNAIGDTARVGYDSVGRVTSVTPAGRQPHVFAYSSTGLLTAYTPPSVGDGAPPLRMVHDADGRLTLQLRQSGDSLSFTYDSTGRTTSVRSAETTTSYTHSPTTGNVTSVSAPTRGTLTFLYDGALVTRHTWSGTVTGNLGFTYDTDFRVATQTVNGGNSITFGYDADSRLTSAGALTLTRDPNNGRITATTLGSLSNSLSYDGYSVPSRFTTSYAGNMIFDIQYLHDSLGRIVSATETTSGVATTFVHTYDAAGRLSTVMKNGAPEASYTYDANGNRTGVTTSAGTLSATVDAQDRLLTHGTTTFKYTKDGELREAISGVDTTRYTYSARDELLSVRLPNSTLIEYLHDPQGRRIGKKINGALVRGWLYAEGLGPVAELDGSNNIVTRFVYAGRANVPEYMIKVGVTYRLVHDHLGSVRRVINTSTGAIAQQLEYDVWGQAIANTSPDFQPFAFAGGMYDHLTHLTRFGARDYSAALGRWTTRDPVLFRGGQTNLYSYVGNDPINRIDATGLVNLAEIPFVAGMIARLSTIAVHVVTRIPMVARLTTVGAVGLNVMLRAYRILQSPQFHRLSEAARTGTHAIEQIADDVIQYDPTYTYSQAMTIARNLWVMGPQAFASRAEQVKTLLHELYRFATSSNVTLQASAEIAAVETLATARAVEAMYKLGQAFRWW